MLGLITISPGSNSYMLSLLEAYKKRNVNIICGKHNFFISNVIPDFVHIHWPELLCDWAPFIEKKNEEKLKVVNERLNWFKNNNVKIIFTVHNIVPHNSSNIDFDNQLYETIIKNADVLVHHCQESINLFQKEYPSSLTKKNIIAHHGDYLLDYKKIEKSEARKALKISNDKFVILNFGQQRKNKGLNFVSKVFKKAHIDNKYLINAGIFSYSNMTIKMKYLTKTVNYFKERLVFSNKKFIFRPIQQVEIPMLFSAVDVVFLGHQSGLTSGVLAMAATFSTPIVMPEIGCFNSQVEHWISSKYNLGNVNSAVNSLLKIYNDTKENNKKLNNAEWLNIYSWSKHVDNILKSLYS